VPQNWLQHTQKWLGRFLIHEFGIKQYRVVIVTVHNQHLGKCWKLFRATLNSFNLLFHSTWIFCDAERSRLFLAFRLNLNIYTNYTRYVAKEMLGDSRKYLYPTMDGMNIVISSFLPKFQNSLPNNIFVCLWKPPDENI